MHDALFFGCLFIMQSKIPRASGWQTTRFDCRQSVTFPFTIIGLRQISLPLGAGSKWQGRVFMIAGRLKMIMFLTCHSECSEESVVNYTNDFRKEKCMMQCFWLIDYNTVQRSLGTLYWASLPWACRREVSGWQTTGVYDSIDAYGGKDCPIAA